MAGLRAGRASATTHHRHSIHHLTTSFNPRQLQQLLQLPQLHDGLKRRKDPRPPRKAVPPPTPLPTAPHLTTIPSIAEGQYYEAHQQLRVLTQRYLKSSNPASAISLLTSGAHALLKASQPASGGDLCLLLVDVYRTTSVPPTHESKSRLLELISALPADEPSRKRFINESVAWTAKFGEFPAGDPELHHFLGVLFAGEGEVYEAEKHLLLGTAHSAEVLANLLYDWYKNDAPHTAPSYIARAVFGYLLLGNIREAARAEHVFVVRLVAESQDLVVQNIEAPGQELRVFPSLPLMNFLSLLVLATQTGGQDTWRNLKAHYAGKLKEVSSWDDVSINLRVMGDEWVLMITGDRRWSRWARSISIQRFGGRRICLI